MKKCVEMNKLYKVQAFMGITISLYKYIRICVQFQFMNNSFDHQMFTFFHVLVDIPHVIFHSSPTNYIR